MKSNLSFVILLAWAVSASAITIETVPVGNPGNAPDSRYVYSNQNHPNGFGAVASSFNIGTTEVTNAQYMAFLTAVAAADPYELYNANMASNTLGGIVRSGSPGSYTYAIKAPALNGTYAYDNKPVNFVGIGDVRRFANWLQNGQPTGAEDATTTEDGAYTLNGAMSRDALVAVTRNSNAIWWQPSEDEWYKAACYNPETGTYFEYPTRTSSVPNNNQPASDTGNSANFWVDGRYTTGNFSYPYTDAGAYTLSASPYGTFDQGGNAFEWTDSLYFGVAYTGFAIRGGGPENCGCAMRAGNRSPGQDSGNEGELGFRVATVLIPEPSTFVLAVGIFAPLAAYRRRHS